MVHEGQKKVFLPRVIGSHPDVSEGVFPRKVISSLWIVS